MADARVGDNISISGAGDNFSRSCDFTVDHSNRYEAGEKQWFDVSGKHGEIRVVLEVRNEDDEVEVRGFLDGKKLSLEDLGLSEDDLAQMDQRQNTADNFEFDGKNWYYRFSSEIGVFHDGRAQGAGFYGWEFHGRVRPAVSGRPQARGRAVQRQRGREIESGGYRALPP